MRQARALEQGRNGTVQAGNQDDDQHQRGQRIDDFHHAHHEVVDAPARIAADHPVGDADRQAHDGPRGGDKERDLRAVKRAGQQVVAVDVRPEPMGAGRGQQRGIRNLVIRVTGKMNADPGQTHDDDQKHGATDEKRIAPDHVEEKAKRSHDFR